MSALSRIKIKGVRASIAANGGIEGGAATLDKSSSLVGSWNNRNQADLPTLGDAFALDEVAMAATGRAPILAALAAELGHVVIALPDAACDAGGVVLALAAATGEFGDVAHAITDGLRDGNLTPAERETIVQQIDEAQEKLAVLRVLALNEGPCAQSAPAAQSRPDVLEQEQGVV